MNPLNVGFSKKDITPPEDCSLIGYTQRVEIHGVGNDGVLDPLFVRVLYLSQANEIMVWVLFDLCILETPCADALKQQISLETGVPESRIILSASHTHSGPYPWQPDWASGAREFVPDELYADASLAYWDPLKQAVVEAVREAKADQQTASLRYRSGKLGFAYNRRVQTEDGITMCWNPRECPEISPESAQDDVLVSLELLREHDRIVLFNVAGHPVTLGKESNQISADWPGAACRQIEAAHPDTHACFVHGAGADAHPWLATDAEPGDLETVAAPVAGLVKLFCASGGEAQESCTLSLKSCEVTVAGKSLSITACQIGPIRVLAFPGELFGQSGVQLRKSCPHPLLLATTSNGWTGYWPPKCIFDQGGYELEAVESFGLKRGDTERMLEVAETLIHSFS